MTSDDTYFEEDQGVEPTEDDSPDYVIDEPYNPAETKIDSERMSLDGLVRRLKYNEIDLNPEFQRLRKSWSDVRMSQLIESILIRIPLPAFYFDGTTDDKWEVVDGLQRLSTLKRFIVDNDLELKGMEYLVSLNGLNFDDLPRPMQRRIEETQVNVHIIRPGTPDKAKYNIFKRINTGGMPLTAQEIRHALNPGPVSSFLMKLSESDEFHKATDGKISRKRMLDREFVLRFCAFWITPPSEYRGGNMDEFLVSAMQTINKMSDTQRDEIGHAFLTAMKAAHDIFGKYAFRKIIKGETRLLRINKALFEAWSVELAHLSDEQRKILIERKDLVMAENIEYLSVEEFQQAITQGTGDDRKVRFRFEAIDDIISDVLANRVDHD